MKVTIELFDSYGEVYMLEVVGSMFHLYSRRDGYLGCFSIEELKKKIFGYRKGV